MTKHAENVLRWRVEVAARKDHAAHVTKTADELVDKCNGGDPEYVIPVDDSGPIRTAASRCRDLFAAAKKLLPYDPKPAKFLCDSDGKLLPRQKKTPVLYV